MGGAGPDPAADSDDTRGGLSLLDPEFWIEVECSCASAFGWTLEQIYTSLDLPTYYAYCKWWVDHPPLYILPRLLMSLAEGLSGNTSSQSPRRSTGPRPPAPKYDQAQSAGQFVSDFYGTFHGQTNAMQRVKKTYYEDTLAEIAREQEQYFQHMKDRHG